MRFLTEPSDAFRTAVAATLCCALWSSVALAATGGRTGAGTPIALAKAAAQAAPTTLPAADAAIRATVSAWAQAWSTQDVERYLAFYAPEFKPRDGQTRGAWEKLRRSRVTGPSSIEVSISGIEIVPHDGARAAVRFRQRYRSNRYQDSVNKTLELVLDGERWLIVAERVGPPAAKAAAAGAPAPAPGAKPGIAAGLGALKILSALGEPLRAEIEIVSLRPDERGRVRAGLASAEAFHRAGIETIFAPGAVKMEIQLRDRKPIIAITTRDAVNEPILEMLVELAWASGRLQRKYALLLDPPTIDVSPPASRDVMRPAPHVAVQAPTAAAPPAPASRPVAADDEYRVLPGDTLTRIARAQLHAGVTLEQMAIALYRANPEAFVDGNINLLAVGRILKIPDRDAATAVDPEQAKATMRALMAGTAEQRAAIAATAPTVPASEGVPATPKPSHTPDQVQLARTKPADASASAAVEDDRIASQRALAETQSRIAELEKIYADLQKLLTIKDTQLTELEKRAAAARSAAAAKTAAPAPKPAIETPTKPVPAPAKPEPAAKPPSAAKPPPPPPASEPSLAHEYLGDPLMQGGLGAVALLLVAYGAYTWRKKKRAAQAWTGEMSWPGPSDAALATDAAATAEGMDSAQTTAAGDEVAPQLQSVVQQATGPDLQGEAAEVDFDVETWSTESDQSPEVDVTLKLNLSDLAVETPAPTEPQPADDEGIHFNVGETTPELTTLEADTPASPDLHLATIEFDQTATESAAAGETETAGEPKPLDIATKLDLAQAYKEIADPDSARELLNEVIAEGDTAQQALAREMLANLG